MAYPKEKYCLKWNDFQQNIGMNYEELRKEADFSDVTLVCEEDHTIEAHRIILTACSPFFSNILKKNKHSHPMIYMRGINAKDLSAIVDFIYHGETNIYQEDLDRFLSLAEELQLKGLVGSQTNTGYSETEINIPPTKYETNLQVSKQEGPMNNENLIVPVEEGKILVTDEFTSEDIALKIDTMIETHIEGEYKCKVCGKINRHVDNTHAKRDLRRHIETHLEGISYPCKLCGKVSRSSNALRIHVTSYHKK